MYGKQKQPCFFVLIFDKNNLGQKLRNVDNKLKILNLARNKISVIHGLDSLSCLNELDLQGNLIDEIKGLDTLTNLKELYLEGNFIRYITNLHNQTQLSKLELDENPLPIELIEELRNNPQKGSELSKKTR